MTPKPESIAIRGAGVVGLWQALTLARAGHAVTLYERSSTPFAEACSSYAGAMLAPRCEEESADPLIRELGLRGIDLWRQTYPGTTANGSLVVALPRDRVLLDRFARMTSRFKRLDASGLAALEPDLAERCLRDYLASRAKSDAAPAFKVHLQLSRLLAARGDTRGATHEADATAALAPSFARTARPAQGL